MGLPYSLDLRTRVISKVEAGEKPEYLASVFNVHKRTIYEWMAHKKKTGSLEPIKNYARGCKLKVNLIALKNLIDEKPDQIQRVLAKELNVTQQTVCRGLKRLGYTRKKNNTYIQRATKI